MDSLVVPGLDTLRQWLDELGISFFECDSCQALHLPHMQNFEGILMPNLTWWITWCFSPRWQR
ncbi:sensory transduction regulator [Klebsiella michiganensis]|nr:sensory transduction regulator [Klebsiella michiganensis]